MNLDDGKRRIFVYAVIGVSVAALIVMTHELLEYYEVPLHNLILLVFIPAIVVGMVLLARRETALSHRNDELERMRVRVNQLMEEAVARGRGGQSFEDRKLVTCWRELDCDKDDCPAFGREHTRCWLLAGTFCRGEVQGQFARKLKDCRLCEVYRKATGDPVSEITENFYAMNYLLGEREDQLEEAFQQARARGEKLAGLVELSEAALSSVHLSDLLDNLLESAAALVGADFGFVTLVDNEENELVARVTYGLDAGAMPQLTYKVGEGVVGQAYASGRVAVSEDIATDARIVNEYLLKSDARTLVTLPLVGRERPLGMLTLGTITSHHYTDEEKDSLQVASDHIAVTIENALLESRVGSGREQVELLMAANRDLGSGGDIENLYDSFIANASRLVDYDRASLMFLNRDASEFEIVAADTESPRTWLGKGIRLPMEAFPVETVVEKVRPLIRSEITGEEFPADKLLVEEGIASEVILPLTSEGAVLGAFSLGSFQPNAFSMEDVEILLPMVRQLGVIIDNARLLQDIKRFDLVDKLTHLYNHRFFFDALTREIARSRRDNQPAAVMILDIVGFREFNLKTSRIHGDRILNGIAEALRASIREIDIAARYSGNKFAVLLPEANADGGGDDNEIIRIANRIRDEIEKKVFEAEDATDLTLCIGISEFPAHADDPVTLLERADWAVRAARDSGNGCVMVALSPGSGREVQRD